MTINTAPILSNEIAQRLVEQLEPFDLHPNIILDLSYNTRFTSDLLKNKFPTATIVSLDDPEKLPFITNTFDLIFSNLTLFRCDFNKIFSEVYSLLRAKGVFLFSSLGPDTLKEMHQDIQDFIDMHHLGDALLQKHFIDPVMSMEQLTVTFSNITTLLQQLPHLLGKEHFKKIAKTLETFQQQDREISITFEIIYGHATKSIYFHSDHQGEVSIPISAIKR